VLVSARKRLGIMGGMFDPVHDGHLQLAQQVKQLCELDEILLVPCGSPVHRAPANTPAVARLAMLELACLGKEWLHVDTRECLSSKPSYTYTTLSAIRAEQPDSVLHLLLGLDAFLAFTTWYRWLDLFDLAHIVVVARPGYQLSEANLDPVLWHELGRRKATGITDCRNSSAGKILVLNVPTPAISSTEIRDMLRNQRDISQYLHKDVAAYIRNYQLYQQPGVKFEIN
jgi:nicotinate-nucleotide adenylyltransferase